MTAQTRGSGHDWDDARKAALFARIVGLELSIEDAARLHGLRVDVIQEWLRLFRRSALLAFDERLKKTLIDQGASADALAAAEFTGHIEDVSIADLVQTIEIAGKDAVITVAHEGREHKMWCSGGAIVDAESGRLSGEAAVYRILGFERGRMVADLRPEPRERTIFAATHRLLLEAMRRTDESAPLLSRLGSVEQLYRLGERSTSARVRVSTDELSLLRLFDGPRRVGDVLAQSQLGDFETLSALVRMLDEGYLIACELSPRSSRGEAARPESTRGAPSPSRGSRALRAVQPGEVAEARGHSRADEPPRSGRDARPSPARPASPSDDGPESADARSRAESAARAARAARPTEPRRDAARTHVSAVRKARGVERAPCVSVAPAEPHGVEEPPRSAPRSYMPLSLSRPPERTTLTPRWVFAAMAAAILAPAAFWFGETMSNLQAARRAHEARSLPAAAEPVAPAALAAEPLPVEQPPPSFAVSTRVVPEAATIWLDHHPVASGRLEIVLPKDGHTHELRAAAEGYIPVTLMFADVAPPREIQLEPLLLQRAVPAAAGSTHAPGGAAREAGLGTSSPLDVAAPARAAQVAHALDAPRPHVAPRGRTPLDARRAAPTAPKVASPEAPAVQPIDASPPVIQVIE